MPNGVCQINGCIEPVVAIVNKKGICSEHYRTNLIEAPMEEIITLGEKIFNPEKPKPWDWGLGGGNLNLADNDGVILQIPAEMVDGTRISENPRLQRMIGNSERMYNEIVALRSVISSREMESILADIEGA